jgi:hypothetical protein
MGNEEIAELKIVELTSPESFPPAKSGPGSISNRQFAAAWLRY